jgi:hypothetical protein
LRFAVVVVCRRRPWPSSSLAVVAVCRRRHWLSSSLAIVVGGQGVRWRADAVLVTVADVAVASCGFVVGGQRAWGTDMAGYSPGSL